MNICEYENGCIEPVNNPFDDKLCIFHSHNKGVTSDEFHNRIRDKIQSGVHEFDGIVFIEYVNFVELAINPQAPYFLETLIFKDCKFLGDSDRSIISKENDTEIGKTTKFCVSFHKISFRKGLHLKNCFFKKAVNLQECKFEKNQFLILNSIFEEEVFLNNSEFNNCDFTINNEVGVTTFHNKVHAHDLKFNSQLDNVNNYFTISKTSFIRGIILTDSIIKCLRFYFNDVKIESENAFFNKLVIESPTILFTKCNFGSINNNFKGMKFSGRTISFENSTFYYSTTFEDAEFNKTDDLSLSINSFKNTNFVGKDVSFWKTVFNCNTADFENSLFNCKVDFKNAKFQDGANFKRAKFTKLPYTRDKENKLILEPTSDSGEASVEFKYTYFEGDSIDFSETEFSCDKIEFDKINLNSEFFFIRNKIYENVNIVFKNLYLTENKRFIFRQPEFKKINEQNKDYPLICFENINFNPIKTSFESILDTKTVKFTGKNGKIYRTPTFVILFRYCYLKDVYFIMTSTSNISFYKSFFDEAIFISSQWNYEVDKLFRFIRYKRRNIIFEDYLLNGELAMGYDFKEMIQDRVAKDKHFNKYKIEDLNGNDEIASLYRRLKTALDRTKDYIQAGWFYFNEYEMLRLFNKHSRGVFSKFRYFVYSIYKYIAGYGEKSFWSLLWIGLFVIIFAILNMFNGIEFSLGKINYDLDLSSQGIDYFKSFNWCADYLNSVAFTFYRILPTSYFPIAKENVIIGKDLGEFGSFIFSFLNITVLIVLIVLLSIGFKRHFRRF